MMFCFFAIALGAFGHDRNKRIPKDGSVTIDIDEFLAREDSPNYQYLDDEDERFDLEDNVNKDIVITTGESSQKRKNEYYACSVSIKKTDFNGNYGLGAGAAAGSGGAIFVSYSSLVSDDGVSFNNNKAESGGAICALASPVFLQKPVFKGNVAFKHGGAIYYQGVFKKDLSISEAHYLMQKGGSYKENKASEIGGAVCLSSCATCQFQDIEFGKNVAGSSGGAICSFNGQIRMFGCQIYNNRAGSVVGETLKKGNDDVRPWADTHFRVRGGGGICFISDPEIRNRVLYTQDCCFKGNVAVRPTSFGNGEGHEIVLDGFALWSSNADKILNFKENISFALGNKEWKNKAGFNGPQVQIFQVDDKATGCIGNDSTITQDTKEWEPSWKQTSRVVEKEATLYVPSPTAYTFVATPITRLPYATTSSPIIYSPTKAFSYPEFPTIKATLIASTAVRSSYPTISASRNNHVISPINPEKPTTTTVTKTWSSSLTLTQISTLTSIITTDSGGIEYTTIIQTESVTSTLTEIEVNTTVVINNEVNDGDTGDSNSMLGIIIGCAVGGLLLIIIIAIVVWFVVGGKVNNEKTSESCVEMAEETVIQIPDSTSAPITNDNPLWTTSVVGDTDDPFKNDFEEEAEEGFFKMRDPDIE